MGLRSWLFSGGRRALERAAERDWDDPRFARRPFEPRRASEAPEPRKASAPEFSPTRYDLVRLEKIENRRHPGTYYYRNPMPQLPRDRPGIKGDGFCGYRIAGAYYYRDTLRLLVEGPYEYALYLRCLTMISSEPDNPHDANAMKVTLGGQTVGHIPRADNVRLRAYLDARGFTGAVACRALIVVKTAEYGGGIDLTLDMPDF